MNLLIFPTTQFKEIPQNIQSITFIEEPTLIYEKSLRPVRINKNKIALFRATMKSFEAKLSKKYKTDYIEYNQAKKVSLDSFKDYHVYDPCDDVITKKYQKYVKFIPNSPAFILTDPELAAIDSSTMTKVFNACKKKLSILETVSSQDEHNQKQWKGEYIPQSPEYKENAEILEEAIEYANTSQFKLHVGDPSFLKYSPITHEAAAAHLDFFIKERFKQFGPFQDAIVSKEQIMYHANISHLLNIGLLTPLQVINRIRPLQSKIPLASYEGFVRQLIGWREYCHYLYVVKKNDIMECFKNKRVKYLNARTWSTGIFAVDNEIAKARSSGYAHHIIRLMIFLNYFKLLRIDPKAIYKWFMEVVSIDAYDWVMYSNIAAMGYYSKKPFMQKPYITTSAYINRMSDYKERIPEWDALFYTYLIDHQQNLGVYARNLATFKKFPKSRQDQMIALARKVIGQK